MSVMAAGASRKLGSPARLWPAAVVVRCVCAALCGFGVAGSRRCALGRASGEQRGAGDARSGDAAHFEQVAARHFLGHGYSFPMEARACAWLKAGPGNVPLPCNSPLPCLHRIFTIASMHRPASLIGGTISITRRNNPLLNWGICNCLLRLPTRQAKRLRVEWKAGREGLAQRITLVEKRDVTGYERESQPRRKRGGNTRASGTPSVEGPVLHPFRWRFWGLGVYRAWIEITFVGSFVELPGVFALDA